MANSGSGPPSVSRALSGVRTALASSGEVAMLVERHAGQIRALSDGYETRIADQDAQLAEVNHRVKNNLQLIISLLSMQAAKLDDKAARGALRATMDQVAAIGLIHDELNVSPHPGQVDFCLSLLILCRRLNEAYGNLFEIEMEMGVGDCPVDVTTAVRLSLVVNEVMTNALKHAFPDGRRGRVVVRLHRTDGVNRLTIADDGVGIGTNHVENTGFRLIGLLSKSIKGRVECSAVPGGGTRFELAF